MRFYLILAFTSLFLISSCSNNEENNIEQSEQTDPIASHSAKINVSGMVCEMGCVATVKKGLLGTGAVTKVSVDFDEDKEVNEVWVEFDENKTDPQALIDVINKLHDQQYKAELVTSNKIEHSKVINNNNNQKKEYNTSNMEASEGFFSIPDLSGLFNKLIR